MLDTLGAQLDGVDRASIEEVKKKLRDLEYRQAGAVQRVDNLLDERLDELWKGVCDRIDDKILGLKIKQEERFEKLEEGLRDFYQDLSNLDKRVTQNDEFWTSEVRVFLVWVYVC